MIESIQKHDVLTSLVTLSVILVVSVEALPPEATAFLIMIWCIATFVPFAVDYLPGDGADD